jgi:hypothetical protein
MPKMIVISDEVKQPLNTAKFTFPDGAVITMPFRNGVRFVESLIKEGYVIDESSRKK